LEQSKTKFRKLVKHCFSWQQEGAWTAMGRCLASEGTILPSPVEGHQCMSTWENWDPLVRVGQARRQTPPQLSAGEVHCWLRHVWHGDLLPLGSVSRSVQPIIEMFANALFQLVYN